MESKSNNFINDLKKEQLLAQFLDSQYTKHLKNYHFLRNYNLKQQYKGVDFKLINKNSQKEYLVDEKAQLDYINEDLPTFAFEINYRLKNKKKKGWLFDENKKTNFYSLITGIYSDEPNKFTSCKITFVNREKLIGYLKNKEITIRYLEHIVENSKITHGKIIVPKLNSKKEGYLYYSTKNKIEKPLNLILKLDFLTNKGLAKRLI